MQNIPLQAVPSQTVSVTLSNQSCQINVYTNAYGLFFDLYVSGTLILGGTICQNLNLIVRDAYFGFAGDFVFYDTSGNGNDPVYTGLGTTYTLTYLSPSDLTALGLAG